MDTPRNPHFALPFGYESNSGSTRVAVVEQDSPEHVENCVLAVLSYEVGSREEAPAFGVPDQTFTLGGYDLDRIRKALATWEPRAVPDISDDFSRISELIEIVRVTLGATNG